jgi:putative ABC transport system substrate-binding protein
MKRREWLLAAAAIALPTLAQGQSAQPRHRIAFLGDTTAERTKPLLAIFKARLLELGHAERRDFTIEERYSEGRPERLAAFAREFVGANPSVIVVGSSAAVAALQKATQSIPIVFLSAGAPVEQGFVKSLSRPGGNITGASNRAMGGAILQLIRDCLPGARRVVILEYEPDAVAKLNAEAYLKAAASSGHDASVVWVKDAADFDRAFAEIVARKAEAAILAPLSAFLVHGETLAGLATKARVPLFSSMRPATASGGLVSYSPDFAENYRRAAGLVDRILRGAKPGDLPVEQPDRFMLTINLRTAKALGIQIPQSVLVRADEVIQ